MTHAGTITIGVDIDGGDLGAKLGAAVRKQVGPMLADMQAELGKTNKSLTGLDGSALKDLSAEADKAAKSTSGMAGAARDATKAQSQQKDATERLKDSTVKLTKAQDEANAAVEVFGENSKEAEKFQKRLTRAETVHTQALIDQRVESTRSAKSQIVDLDEVAVAHEHAARRHAVADNNIAASAERSAQRRVAAEAKAATAEAGGGGGAPPGAGSTTARGGGPRRRGGGGGGRGGRLTSGFTGAAVFNAGALAIGNIPAATTAVVNLVGAVQQLAQAGGLLPGIFAGAATSVGTAVIGFHGMKDAIKALNDAAKSGDPKDLEKATEALKDMAPAAVDTAKAVSTFIQGPWKDLQKQTAQNMFVGVDKTIDDLANKTMPTLSRGTAEVGSAWNNTFKELGRVGGLDSTQGFLDKIFGNTADAQNRANAAIAPLTHALGTLTSESSDFLPRLGDGLTGLSTRFDNFITKSANNGNLDKWINEGIDAAKHLGDTFLNIAKIITDITKAAGGDGGLLKFLDEGSTKLANFLGSDQGQEKLSRFFADGRQQLAQWLPILQNLGPILLDIYQASRQWADVLMPFLRDALGLLDRFPGLVQAGLLAFLAYKTLNPFVGLLSSLGKVDSLLGSVGTKAGGLKGKLGNLSALGPGLALGGAISNANAQSPGDISGLGVLATIGGGALTGAQLGGPVGAAFGALGGAAVALTEVFLAQKRKLDDDQRKQQDFLDHRPPAIPGLPANAPVVGGAAVQPGNILGPARPELGPTTVRGLLLGPEAGVGGGSGGELRNLPAIDTALAAINDKAAAARGNMQLLATGIQTLPTGQVVLKDNTPEAIQRVKDLGYAVTKLPDGQIQIQVQYMLDGHPISRDQLVTPIRVAATPGGTAPIHGGGRAGGGVIPGYSPGVDNVLWPMSRGEGVLIPEAVRGIGGAAGVYAINSMFRKGLSRRGYADGGVHLGTGLPPGPDGGDPVIALLTQIRDLLAGKGGVGTPLVDTANATSTIADASTGTGTGGQQLGPFGTPLKPRNPGYEAAAAAISALGGDPEKFLGADPSTLGVAQGGMLPGLQVLGSTDFASVATALKAFATSGSTDALAGTGLGINDTVVTALTAARNKGKGGLTDEQISGLVDQVLTGGGFSGTLDTSNTPVVKALTKYRDKLAKGQGLASPVGAGISGAGGLAGGLPAGLALGGLDPVSAFAAAHSGGQYQWGASDLANGLADCSGAVSDLVELITKGQTSPDRLFSTANEAQVLQSLGAVPGLIPGTLQIGFNSGHTAATLPNGVNFESGGSAGGPTYGGAATGAADPQFTQQFSLPVNGVIPGLAAGSLGAGAGSGTPVYVTNWPGQQGQLPPGVQQVLGAGLDAAGQSASNVTGDVLGAIGSAHLGTGRAPGPPADYLQLLTERNPLALAAMAGFDVPDFSRAGGQNLDFLRNQGPGFTADGQTFSDTASLTERTTTDLQAQLQAEFDQLVQVMEEVRQKLTDDALIPIVQTAIQQGIEGLKGAIVSDMGNAIGQAAAGPIADAVKAAVSSIPAPTGGQDAGQAGFGDAIGAFTGALFAGGGAVVGGTPGKDSVPIMAQQGEWVLNNADVARLGGTAGVARFVGALRGGGIRGFADGGEVSKANATVGADFFGVSEVPIIGAIVNLLVQVLLKIIGVNIEVRDTMNTMTDEFRQFRGDAFKAFDAQGRLLNDTSALLDRSSTSEQAAADERISILKIVIQALIKYIIEKVIVPITKAVANAAIQAGASAAGAAINTQAPGAGGIVSSLISSAGQAGVEIVADVGSDFWVAASSAIIEGIGQLLTSFFPGITTGIFSGAWLESIIGPTNSVLGGLLGGLLAPILSVVSFDEGGVATGTGYMPKNIIAPERVLSPSQNTLFERMVQALESGQGGGSSRSVTVGDIHLHGSDATPARVKDELLALI